MDNIGLEEDYEKQIGGGEIGEEINTEVETDNPLALENNYVFGKDEERVIPEHLGSSN